MTADRETIAGAVARGWCHPSNSAKEMDSDLALAIVDEVLTVLGTPASEGAAQVADPAYRNLGEFLALKDAPDVDDAVSARTGWNACARLYGLPDDPDFDLSRFAAQEPQAAQPVAPNIYRPLYGNSSAMMLGHEAVNYHVDSKWLCLRYQSMGDALDAMRAVRSLATPQAGAAPVERVTAEPVVLAAKLRLFAADVRAMRLPYVHLTLAECDAIADALATPPAAAPVGEALRDADAAWDFKLWRAQLMDLVVAHHQDRQPYGPSFETIRTHAESAGMHWRSRRFLVEQAAPAVPVQGVAPAGWKLLKDTTQDERSWPEDFDQENGCYFNQCHNCLRVFVGYKRRVVCRVCAAARAEQQDGEPR